MGATIRYRGKHVVSLCCSGKPCELASQSQISSAIGLTTAVSTCKCTV